MHGGLGHTFPYYVYVYLCGDHYTCILKTGIEIELEKSDHEILGRQWLQYISQ